MKILVLGINGMLGHVIMNYLNVYSKWTIYGTTRNKKIYESFKKQLNHKVYCCRLEEKNELNKLIIKLKPTLIINCIGIVKQNQTTDEPLSSILMNTLFPHELAKICKKKFIRLINFSSDCVFSGNKGRYSEVDKPDPIDLYGRTKLLGEVYSDNVLTIRTSFLGHQINSKYSLLEWFLSQKDECLGFEKAIYSGLPTIEIAEVLKRYILPNEHLSGLYQLSSDPISKYELLTLIKKVYNLKLNIIKDNKIIIDRSLDSKKFRDKTGYKPPKWNELIKKMYKYRRYANV